MINMAYISELTSYISSQTQKAVINDSIEITAFSLKQVTNNVLELKFSVSAAQTTQINNIKLKKADNTVISDNDVDIPVTQDEVIIRHLITISEVTS